MKEHEKKEEDVKGHHVKHVEHREKVEHVKEHVKKHAHKHKKPKEEKILTAPVIMLMIVIAAIVLFNQVQINNISQQLITGSVSGTTVRTATLSGSNELANIDVLELKSTGHTIAAVFPVEDIQTADDALAMMFPVGTPDYGDDLGVSYDDPIVSLATLSKMYPGLRIEVMNNNQDGWDKFMNLASKPVGISCEYCCGVGPIGINADGSSGCGCQHNPALLTVALYLSAYTDYSDGEILREVMRWKTLFFPRKMIELGTSLAGGDTSALADLPGMVGGC